MGKYSLFIKFFISLIVLLVVPVIIIGTISSYTILHYSEDEISKTSIGKLKVAVNISRQLSESINKEAVRLSINNIVNGLNNIDVINELNNIDGRKLDIYDIDRLMGILHMQDILMEMVRTNNQYHSVYLYLEDFDYTVTSNNGLVSNNILENTDWMKYYREFKQNRASLPWVRTKVSQNINENGNRDLTSDYVITYIYPLTPYTTNLNGAIVINVKENALNNLINSNNFDSEGYICIINNKGDFISQIDSGDLLYKSISDKGYIDKIINSKIEEGYVVVNIDGKKSLVSYYKSDFNNWIYLGIFPLNTLTSRVNKILMSTTYISLFIVVIGVIASYIISKRLYNPVKKLIQDIKAAKGIDFKDNEDEMMLLQKVFNNIIRQEDSLFDVLEKSKRNIIDNYLRNLLKGNLVDEIDGNMVGVDFVYTYYICTIISIDRYREFAKTYDEEQQHYMKVLILKVAEEILNMSFSCVGVNMDKGEIALIINVEDKDAAKLSEKLKGSFCKVKEEIAKVLDYSISVGIGCCHGGKESIKDSYSEAQQAIRFKLKSGYGSINIYQDEPSEYKYYYPFVIEEYILNYLNVRSKNDIVLTMNELIDEVKYKNNLSCDNIIQIFNQLVGNTIIKYLVNSNVNINDIFDSKFNIYRELSTKETLDEIKYWLTDIYLKIIDYCNESKHNRQYNLDKITEFINKNYRNDIGISDIAEYVGLSYSHVRKIFKDATGKNIVDYINEIRIKEAKKLLIETDMTIKDIALYLGYNNDQSFNRFFKKYEGITPGDFRNKNAASIQNANI